MNLSIAWIVFLLIGVVGFVALGYVQIYLANGKRFQEQDKKIKIIISCVSAGQFPCMVMIGVSLVMLVKTW
jgi:hypothetical protein